MQNTNEAILSPDTAFSDFQPTEIAPPENSVTNAYKFPRLLTYIVLAICALPFLLNSLGIDFSSVSKPFDLSTAAGLSPVHLADAMFYRLNGAFTHALLEWSAFSIAIFTFILAICHYRITGNVTTPVIGLALVCAGCMDAFHTLAAARLIDAVAENNNLIPFTWAISRTFNAVIMIAGVGIFLLTDINKLKMKAGFIGIVSGLFILAAYLIIHYCATNDQLPQTMYPEALITRPWDAGPLLLFLLAGLYFYPKFHKRQPSIFAHALIISAIPEVVVEMHMAFGSTALFDNHFNIAHFLKIIAYTVPFAGLVLDYIYTHRRMELTNDTLAKVLKKSEQAAVDLSKSNLKAIHTMEELKRSNKELEQFAYIASHDLREPLRKVSNYTELFAKRYAQEVDEKGGKYINYIIDGTQRMDRLINDLLLYSRVSQSNTTYESMQMNEILKQVIDNLQVSIEKTQAQITHDPLPEVGCNATQLEQVLQNLIANALKFHGDAPPRIHISAVEHDEKWEFSVRDEGIGFDEQYADRIFSIFKRLHTRDEYTGTGIGLAICKSCVERHGGRIWAKSEPGKGATFFFTISKSDNHRVQSQAIQIQEIAL